MTPTGLELDGVTGLQGNDLGKSAEASAAQSGAFSGVFRSERGAVGGASTIASGAAIDPDLALVVSRWPTLPAETKAAVLAIVRKVD